MKLHLLLFKKQQLVNISGNCEYPLFMLPVFISFAFDAFVDEFTEEEVPLVKLCRNSFFCCSFFSQEECVDFFFFFGFEISITRMRLFASEFPLVESMTLRLAGTLEWHLGNHQKAMKSWKEAQRIAEKRSLSLEIALSIWSEAKARKQSTLLTNVMSMFKQIGAEYYFQRVVAFQKANNLTPASTLTNEKVLSGNAKLVNNKNNVVTTENSNNTNTNSEKDFLFKPPFSSISHFIKSSKEQ